MEGSPTSCISRNDGDRLHLETAISEFFPTLKLTRGDIVNLRKTWNATPRHNAPPKPPTVPLKRQRTLTRYAAKRLLRQAVPDLIREQNQEQQIIYHSEETSLQVQLTNLRMRAIADQARLCLAEVYATELESSEEGD